MSPIRSNVCASPQMHRAMHLNFLRASGWQTWPRHGHGAAHCGAGGVMTALLAAVWLPLDYPWGLWAFVWRWGAALAGEEVP
jgi:hypothetical protein